DQSIDEYVKTNEGFQELLDRPLSGIANLIDACSDSQLEQFCENMLIGMIIMDKPLQKIFDYLRICPSVLQESLCMQFVINSLKRDKPLIQIIEYILSCSSELQLRYIYGLFVFWYEEQKMNELVECLKVVSSDVRG